MITCRRSFFKPVLGFTGLGFRAAAMAPVAVPQGGEPVGAPGPDAAMIQKRIRIFTELQAAQRRRNEEQGGQPINIEANGEVYPGRRLLTTPLEIARQVFKGEPKKAGNCLIAEVNGTLWDMARPLEGDCKLALYDFSKDQGRDTFWHSSAHILGESLEQEYGCKLCIGPCTTRGEGFYYDAFYEDGRTLNEENFGGIHKQVKKAVQEKQPFERIEVTREQALELFAENQFKVEIINDLPEDATITVYRCGPLVDLCRGPHVPNTSYVAAFSCLKASSCYWKGKQDRESLQRVYGISYPDQASLKDYMHRYEEAKKRDHRLLGQKDQLFFFHELSPGSAFFLPKGTIVYNKLLQFIRSEYRKRGFEEVVTPNIFNMKLWEQSGHAAHYKENMFVFEIEKQEFGLKPMNCPGHCLLFQHRVRSYRELPLRIADFGVLHRNELSGALSGLTRVRRFSQDDAHIFCMESQVFEEVKGCLDFLDYVYTIFNFQYELKLSTRPEGYLGESSTWDRAEAALANALDAHGKPWERNEGDGAFYGPKIDIQVSDALKRKFQCATIQLDFQMPIRFKLGYSAEDEAKIERPVIIHRAILGSVERMFAILLEDNGGLWPFWLSPRQAIVLTISEKFKGYAEEVRHKLHAQGYEVDVDVSDRKLDKKIREAQMAHYNYLLVVGNQEQEAGAVNVRLRGSKGQRGSISIDDLLEEFKSLVESYK